MTQAEKQKLTEIQIIDEIKKHASYQDRSTFIKSEKDYTPKIYLSDPEVPLFKIESHDAGDTAMVVLDCNNGKLYKKTSSLRSTWHRDHTYEIYEGFDFEKTDNLTIEGKNIPDFISKANKNDLQSLFENEIKNKRKSIKESHPESIRNISVSSLHHAGNFSIKNCCITAADSVTGNDAYVYLRLTEHGYRLFLIDFSEYPYNPNNTFRCKNISGTSLTESDIERYISNGIEYRSIFDRLLNESEVEYIYQCILSYNITEKLFSYTHYHGIISFKENVYTYTPETECFMSYLFDILRDIACTKVIFSPNTEKP